MTKIDIIIPAYNQSDFTVKCLESIREYSSNYRVILIDNGSEQEEFLAVEKELNKHPHILIRNYKNVGFVKAINQGICLITSPYVVFLNNDTKVVPGWIEKLKSPLIEDTTIGITGPTTTAINCWQGREVTVPGYRILPQSAMLAFFCAMFPQKVIDSVGLLDENFGVGLADDDDYCYRVKQHGYKLALVQDLKIPHFHRTTFKTLYSEKEITRMTAEGINYFQEKHGLKK